MIWEHRELETARSIAYAESGLEGLTKAGGYVVEPSQVLTLPMDYELGSELVRQVGNRRDELTRWRIESQR